LINTAHQHVNIADAMNGQVVDVLKAVERKASELKKKASLPFATSPHHDHTKLSKEMQLFQKLLSDRDQAYSDRVKVRPFYDRLWSECLTNWQTRVSKKSVVPIYT
jgi:hypothetical protein